MQLSQRRLLIILTGCLALAIGGPACSASSGKTAGNTVSMTGARRFEPEVLTVKKGTTITFINDSEEPHSVTGYSERIPDGARFFSTGGFSTEQQARDNVTETLIQQGDTFDLQLTKPGTYGYFCIPHESQGMTGTIVVEG